MRDVQRLTADEFFAWQALVEGRYELVDGHIVPHPAYVTPTGFAAPDAEHGLVCLNLGIALQAQLRAPCRAYVGVCVVVDRADANISDVAVSCDQDDRSRPALIAPRYVFEVSSPKTYRIDTGGRSPNTWRSRASRRMSSSTGRDVHSPSIARTPARKRSAPAWSSSATSHSTSKRSSLEYRRDSGHGTATANASQATCLIRADTSRHRNIAASR